METLGLIKEVGAYSERQYQKQDGTTEYFKSRGVVLKHGGDEVYGEMTGEYASKNRDTQYYENQPYVVKGYWKHRIWPFWSCHVRCSQKPLATYGWFS